MGPSSPIPEISDADMEYQAEETHANTAVKPFWQQYRLFHATFAQFCYTGSQVAIAGYLINYIGEVREGTSDATAARFLAVELPLAGPVLPASNQADDPGKDIRIGLIVAAVFFLGFLGWAAFARLDAAANAPSQPGRLDDGEAREPHHGQDALLVRASVSLLRGESRDRVPAALGFEDGVVQVLEARALGWVADHAAAGAELGEGEGVGEGGVSLSPFLTCG